MNFIKLVGICQFLILQFAVTIAEGNGSNESQGYVLKKIQDEVKKYADEFWKKFKEYLCIICKKIVSESADTCNEDYVAILVIVVLFVLVFSIFCLICCKCCCKKSCCKKDENDESDKSDESDVDYNQYIMGPDGQMYSQMYEGQMMDPQLFQAGMMYPQMYQEQMYYPQMYNLEMQQPEMYNPEMQQSATQEPGKKT